MTSDSKVSSWPERNRLTTPMGCLHFHSELSFQWFIFFFLENHNWQQLIQPVALLSHTDRGKSGQVGQNKKNAKWFFTLNFFTLLLWSRVTCWEERKSAKKTEQGSLGLYEGYGSIGGVARYFFAKAFGSRFGFICFDNFSCSYLRRPHLRTECWRREATRITLNAILGSKISPPHIYV